MKFAVIAALVATTQAAVGDACEGTTGCEETECCGTGVPDTENGFFEGENPPNVTVCQTEGEAAYANADNEDELYTFTCNTAEAAGDAAVKLVATATAIMTAYLVM